MKKLHKKEVNIYVDIFSHQYALYYLNLITGEVVEGRDTITNKDIFVIMLNLYYYMFYFSKSEQRMSQLITFPPNYDKYDCRLIKYIHYDILNEFEGVALIYFESQPEYGTIFLKK